ncbi:hypothetical protein MCAP1_000636 [Malassezia caprae]|uniref:Alpha/beta hydrolase fold-3 domain-containing protein n=1 Tax=Malassezia caprae TaxID=1381934 RepID=A0AAF0E435_9BASI|nr:hypothetical protein MCAP1_000636 [Malassezia caprae]
MATSTLRTNATAQFPRFLSIALSSVSIVQQLCIVLLFVALFVHLYLGTVDASILVWTSVAVTVLLACTGAGNPFSLNQSLPGVLVLSFTLYSLSPVVRTFSEATTSDSVWACAAVLFFGHLAFADYRMNASSLAQLASTISLNMGMCASVVLSSRLRLDLDVFALLLVALQLFAIYPLLRTRIYARFGYMRTSDGYRIPFASIPLTIVLLVASIYGMLPHSRLVALYLHPMLRSDGFNDEWVPDSPESHLEKGFSPKEHWRRSQPWSVWSSKPMSSSLSCTEFPNQGHGILSEFFVQRPIWTWEPLRSLYVVWFFLYMLFFAIPLRALVYIPRCARPRPSWSWKKSVMVSFIRSCTILICKTRIMLSGQPSSGEPKVHESIYLSIDPSDVLTDNPEKQDEILRGELRRAMNLQGTQVLPTSGYFVAKSGECAPKDVHAKPGERLLVHLHGGAYWLGSAQEHYPSAKFCRSLLDLLQDDERMPSRAFLVEYRLAKHTRYQQGSYPAALLDTLIAYLYLVQCCGFRPENIILSGDSSGGNLALALCRYLRDERVENMPHSLLLLSPWCDVSRSHSGPLRSPNPFSTTVLNRQSDIIDASQLYRNSAVCPLLGRLPASEAYTNPYLSPVSLQLDPQNRACMPHWGFEGFPARTLICTGSAELNAEQHMTLAYRMAEGTLRGRPVRSGDLLMCDEEAQGYTLREQYPRSTEWLALHDEAVRSSPSPSMVVPPLEDREVVLDGATDGIHIYPMFSWFEPERSQALARLAAWIKAGAN